MNELYFYSRRIGYSVGLDSVYPRLVELAQLYVEHKKFDITVWNKAVNSWGVKTKVEFSKQSAKKSISSADHISNFMFYLDILNNIKKFDIPKFSFDGKYLKERGMKEGRPMMRKTMTKLIKKNNSDTNKQS